MKRSFFQAVVVSILLYGCTTWTLSKRLKKKLDGNYTRMLRAILHKSCRHHPRRHQLYGHLPPITKTIQVRRTRHAGHCWRSKDELISDVLQWTPAYGKAKAGRPARTYIQQLCEDTGCNPEDLQKTMNDWDKWQERIRDIRAVGTTWWWWYKCLMRRSLCNSYFRMKWSHRSEFKSCVTPQVAFIFVCVGASQRIFLPVLKRNPHKGHESEISLETGNGEGKEGPREDRESELTKHDRRDPSAWESNQEKEDTINRSQHG